MISRVYKDFKPAHHAHPHDARHGGQVEQEVGKIADDEIIEVSIYLKPSNESADAGQPEAGQGDLRQQLAAKRERQHGAHITLLQDFAQDHGLTVTFASALQRLVKISGPASKIQAAFDTRLALFTDGKHHYRGRSGHLRLPEELHDIVADVMGLTNRRAVHNGTTSTAAATTSASSEPVYTGFWPNKVASLYGFPADASAQGQNIAILQFGGGYLPSDLSAAFGAMSLPVPSVTDVSIDGAKNAYSTSSSAFSANLEIALDLQVAGSCAPGAGLIVYFAPNSYSGFANALHAAIYDSTNHPAVISMSWGAAECSWPSQTMSVMDTALQDAAELGISCFMHAGDYLSADQINDGKVHVNFPASSPWAIGCGGTQIEVDANGANITSESVWNVNSQGIGTGGGVSEIYGLPSFQQNVGVPVSVSTKKVGRGVPDVAASASRTNGYNLVLGGQYVVVGGTSAVAPLWASLAALINNKAGTSLGFFLPSLYQNPQLCSGVTQGNNFMINTELGYSACNGWNACTGLGTPKGAALYSFFT